MQTTENDGPTGEMSVMDRSGDEKVVWNRFNEDEVERAQVKFAELRAKGHVAYKMEPGGEKGEQIDAFDPTIERIIFVPQMRGG